MRTVGSFTPNSAAAERVFSLLKGMFGDQQIGSGGPKVARVRKWRTPRGGRRPGVQPTRRAGCSHPRGRRHA